MPPAPTSPFLTAPALGNFGGIRGGFRGKSSSDSAAGGTRGEAAASRLSLLQALAACSPWVL